MRKAALNSNWIWSLFHLLLLLRGLLGLIVVVCTLLSLPFVAIWFHWWHFEAHGCISFVRPSDERSHWYWFTLCDCLCRCAHSHRPQLCNGARTRQCYLGCTDNCGILVNSVGIQWVFVLISWINRYVYARWSLSLSYRSPFGTALRCVLSFFDDCVVFFRCTLITVHASNELEKKFPRRFAFYVSNGRQFNTIFQWNANIL